MSPSRRALLRAGLLGLGGTLAGCAGDEEMTTTRTSTTVGTRGTSTVTTWTRTMEFVHRQPVFSRGVFDVQTWYYGHVLDEDGADGLAVSTVPDDVAGQSTQSVERFITDTPFETTALVAVQAELPSPTYGLSFDFVDRKATPPQLVCHVDRRDRQEGDTATSTLFVRVPARVAPKLRVTLLDRISAVRADPVHLTETFDPPNVRVFECANVQVRGATARVSEQLGIPGAALVTTQDAAERFAPPETPFAEFTRETDYDMRHLLALQLSGSYHLWPTDVITGEGQVIAELRRAFGGAPNSIYTSLLLARIHGADPEGGTAVVRSREREPSDSGTKTFPLSSDPDKWGQTNSTTTATPTGNRS